MLTPYHSQYYACELSKRNASDSIAKLGPSLFSAQVDLNPHQLDAALFAFRSPLSRGAILADEVGLGKTIEASLIISQLWAERKRRILVIAPTILRKQWAQELEEKFYIPSVVMDTREYNTRRKTGGRDPLALHDAVLICSYQFVRARELEFQREPWDLVVIDDDICYDEQADLLYKLAGQMVTHLRSYLPDDEAVESVLSHHQRQLADLIHTQMQKHVWTSKTEYEAKVSRGFQTLRPNTYSAGAGEGVRNFRQPLEERQDIRKMLFGGFARCLYSEQKFDSDPERRFAVLLEDEQGALKWFKPARGQFQIYYHQDQAYEPDFVVETETAKYLCEPKRKEEMDDEEVQAKARAAVRWCGHATTHGLAHDGKPWSYVLIPHDAIQASVSLAALLARYTLT